MYMEGRITRRLHAVVTNSKAVSDSTTLTPVDRLDNNIYDSHGAAKIHPKDSIRNDKDQL
jgi:hypothetical protein